LADFLALASGATATATRSSRARAKAVRRAMASCVVVLKRAL
jgi:hypothetical protein